MPRRQLLLFPLSKFRQNVIGWRACQAPKENRQEEDHQGKGARQSEDLDTGSGWFCQDQRAVEGIALRASTTEMFADFDRRGLARPSGGAIFAKHAKKA